MGGGLLNLISENKTNSIIHGNPSKTFFKNKYVKHTNFGMQKFRLDYQQTKILSLTHDTDFVFNISRYADLLMDTYFVIKLPDIWSPIVKIHDLSYNIWPYEFKWIENIGCQILKKVSYKCSGKTIYEFTGDYLHSMVERDFSSEKKKLFDEMTGNTKELNDPANYGGRNNIYPNAVYLNNMDIEPSIRGRLIYVPLNIWSTLSSYMAFPLISLQYEILTIEVTCRPIQELFVVRYIPNPYYNNEDKIRVANFKTIIENNNIHLAENSKIDKIGSYVMPNQLENQYSFNRFLYPPPNISEDLDGNILFDDISNNYPEETTWDSNIHLISTYVFLSEEERLYFSQNTQEYLITEVYEKRYFNVTGNNLIDLESNGLVKSWMWFFQRSDVFLRNQWNNYSNWETNELPHKGIPYHYIKNIHGSIDGSYNFPSNIQNILSKKISNSGSPAFEFNINSLDHNIDEYYLISGNKRIENEKNIMIDWGLILSDKYRETVMDYGVYDYIEKYNKTNSFAKNGIYCYNFCLDTNPLNTSPSGAINLSNFNKVQFEINTIKPPFKDSIKIHEIYDNCGNLIGIKKPVWELYKYNYNLHIMEERYNILSFNSGMANLKIPK